MSGITIKIINSSAYPLPAYATPGASGLDLRANMAEPLTLQPLERTLVPTGIRIEIPPGYEAQVRPRSGLAIKQGITCLNTPGTIDSDYRGELQVILINLDQAPQTLQPGDRIAQLVFQQVTRVTWEETGLLEDSHRGAGGFGHTGSR